MAQIDKLFIQNFKSLHDIELEMRPLNILIGANGSGKSNLIQFFEMMSEAADGNLETFIRERIGIEELLWKGDDTYHSLIEVRFKNELNKSINADYGYRVVLRIRNYRVSIEEESLHSKEKTYLLTNDRMAKITDDENEVMIPFNDYYDQSELFVSQFRDPTRFQFLNVARVQLRDWSVYGALGQKQFDAIYMARPLEPSFPLKLDHEYKRFVSVLYAFANEARYESAQEELDYVLSSAFPDFKKLDIRNMAAGRVALYWRTKQGWQIPASSLSDGILRFLGLAVLLLLPDPPPLIAIDEPEIGLHPRLLPLLAALMKDASKRTQLIVTTHSPQLINAESIEVDDVVVTHMEEGATHFERLKADELKLWLERYTLGNLWMMGKLES